MVAIKSRPQLSAMNALRGFAFCLVYIAHAGNSYTDFGPWGVSLFFVMSGFLMIYNYSGIEKITNVGIQDNFLFAWNKIKSLYFLHIITTLAMLLLKFNSDSIDQWLIKLSLNVLLIQEWFPSTSISINPVSWYLSVAFFLYFIFPWILQILESKKPNANKVYFVLVVVFILQIIFCLLGGRLGRVFNQNHVFEEFTKWIDYKHPVVRSTDFIMGCLLGYLFVLKKQDRLKDGDKNIEEKGLLAILLSVIAAFLFLYMKKVYGPDSLDRPERWWTYCVIFSPGSLLMTWIFAKGKGWLVKLIQNRFFLYCGAISSVGFLLHTVIINYASQIVSWGIARMGINVPGLARTSLLIPICFILTVIAVKIWGCIEKKIKPCILR